MLVSAHHVRRGSRWTFQSSLRKSFFDLYLTVTGYGVFPSFSGCTSCITGSFYRSFADAPGTLSGYSFMNPLNARMYSRAAYSCPRPSEAWPTGTPHVHSLITNACWDREGNQYVMAEIGTADLKIIEELFAASVFKMLLKENMISKELVGKMSSWKHSGFRDLPGTNRLWPCWFQCSRRQANKS